MNAKVFRGSTTSVDPARMVKYGLGSTTAREMVKLFEELGARPRLVDSARADGEYRPEEALAEMCRSHKRWAHRRMAGSNTLFR